MRLLLLYLFLPESVKLNFLQKLLRIDVIHCVTSTLSTQLLFVTKFIFIFSLGVTKMAHLNICKTGSFIICHRIENLFTPVIIRMLFYLLWSTFPLPYVLLLYILLSRYSRHYSIPLHVQRYKKYHSFLSVNIFFLLINPQSHYNPDISYMSWQPLTFQIFIFPCFNIFNCIFIMWIIIILSFKIAICIKFKRNCIPYFIIF